MEMVGGDIFLTKIPGGGSDRGLGAAGEVLEFSLVTDGVDDAHGGLSCT